MVLRNSQINPWEKCSQLGLRELEHTSLFLLLLLWSKINQFQRAHHIDLGLNFKRTGFESQHFYLLVIKLADII